jgi:5'-nucleotidase
MERRTFVKHLGVGTLLVGGSPVAVSAMDWLRSPIKLTILHTNDVHSRVDPFDSGRYAGKGGAARRAATIDRVRKEEDHVLLLDAGDIFQGTPYFNYFGGELEFKLMSEMKYDAATIGNHDFDAGIDGLHAQLPNADFPFLISNYDFSDTILDGKTKPYQVFRKGPLRIGVFGLGIELEGLVPKVLYKDTRYLDPVEKARETARILRHEEQCDYVICLSHLGYLYGDDTISDVALGKTVSDIDLIIGGHTHTFLDKPTVVKNPEGRPVLINQAGWAGIVLGRLDIYFNRTRSTECTYCENILVGGVEMAPADVNR